jgi:hypothetical protein
MRKFTCMITLRWILGAVIVLLIGGFLFLFMVASGLRKSFGASENHPLLAILPVVAAGLLLAGLLLPASKPLLHAAAVAAVGLIGFCVWMLIRESATVLWFGLFYLCVWLVYYGLAAWSHPATGDRAPESSARSTVLSQTQPLNRFRSTL